MILSTSTLAARLATATLLIALVPTAWAEPLTEDGCSIAYTEAGSSEARFRETPGLSILNWNPAQPLQLPGMGDNVTGILCWRSAARFSANDYVVPLAGLPLYIKTDLADPKRNRTLVLEGTETGFRVRQLGGPALSKSEQGELRQLIKLYNAARQERQPAERKESATAR